MDSALPSDGIKEPRLPEHCTAEPWLAQALKYRFLPHDLLFFLEGTCILLKNILMANEEVIGDYLKIQIESIVRMFGYDYPYKYMFFIWAHLATQRFFTQILLM